MEWRAAVVLWALWLIPLYLWVDAVMGRRGPSVRFSTLALLSKPSRLARSTPWLRRSLKALALAVLVLGVAQPELPRSGGASSVEGIDICLALDISRSMRAEDFAPNRLEAAKETLRAFVRERENDRIGLVVFAGAAFLQCPLTLGADALDDLIRSADFSLTDAEGTALGDALVKSTARLAASLQDAPERSRVVVLLTDGENNRGGVDPLSATQMAAAIGVKVYTVGVGGDQGVPIPLPDPVLGTTYSRDVDGSLILTSLDEGLLRQIAEGTGGRYFNAANRRALEQVVAAIDRLETSTIENREPQGFRSVAHWFYLVAFLLVIVEAALGRTWLRVLP